MEGVSSRVRLRLARSTPTNQEDLPRSVLHLETENIYLQRDECEVVLFDENVSENSLLLEDSTTQLGRARDEEDRVGVRGRR